LKRDSESREKAPEVIKDDIKKDSQPKGSRAYSTLRTVEQSSVIDDADPGFKFNLPTLPLPKGDIIKHRYDPLVEQVTNLMMKHGKKSVAQRVRSSVL
jgi:small subunit ribosomal protein S7